MYNYIIIYIFFSYLYVDWTYQEVIEVLLKINKELHSQKN